MANKKKSKFVKIFGVTVPSDPTHRTGGYGHGTTRVKDEKDVFVDYVDYSVDHLIACIKKERKEKIFIEKLTQS